MGACGSSAPGTAWRGGSSNTNKHPSSPDLESDTLSPETLSPKAVIAQQQQPQPRRHRAKERAWTGPTSWRREWTLRTPQRSPHSRSTSPVSGRPRAPPPDRVSLPATTTSTAKKKTMTQRRRMRRRESSVMAEVVRDASLFFGWSRVTGDNWSVWRTTQRDALAPVKWGKRVPGFDPLPVGSGRFQKGAPTAVIVGSLDCGRRATGRMVVMVPDTRVFTFSAASEINHGFFPLEFTVHCHHVGLRPSETLDGEEDGDESGMATMTEALVEPRKQPVLWRASFQLSRQMHALNSCYFARSPRELADWVLGEIARDRKTGRRAEEWSGI